MVAETIVRRWCQALSTQLPRRNIYVNGAPYLERYTLAGEAHTEPGARGAIYLHHFVASDAEREVHSHPWAWSMSLILTGGYREERCHADGRRTVDTYRPGDLNVFASGDKHRVDLLGVDAWTLFFAGEFDKPWGFSPRC